MATSTKTRQRKQNGHAASLTATKQTITKSPKPSAPKATEGRLWNKLLGILIAVIVLLYAPISATYFLVGPQIGHVGDKYYYKPLISWNFAYGNGSGHPGYPGSNYEALKRNASAMMPHSVLGTVAIVLGLIQFLPVFQFRYPAIHRNLGRLYGLCAMVISWSSASFLRDTIPKKDVFSGDVFALILSLLSFGNLVTMGLAVAMAWSGDIGSHREFMALNYSLMLSAPLLRVAWLILGITWGETKYIINLYSSYFAGPFLLTAPMFYLRRHYKRQANKTLMNIKLHLGITAASAASLVYVIPLMAKPEMWAYRRTEYFWFTIPQFVFQAVAFTWLAAASMQRGDDKANTAWRTYQNGLISAPIFAAPMYHFLRYVYNCPDEMMGLGVTVGAWTTGLVTSFVIYVLATSKFVNKPAAGKGLK
ncbi:hypothetical protein VHEMI10247 [[Torrubiella] hemipterigena]|uniref:Uncharacterized protein n=1 Tax=[Torrubiella] hemipterigena TaxID=1531966 RepID=A0A0A1TCI1_9HYPO|nr:hypothetical protein VHEMI10247 [[Torrubiella] hemipterigena]